MTLPKNTVKNNPLKTETCKQEKELLAHVVAHITREYFIKFEYT